MADLYSSKEQPAQGKGSSYSHKRHTSAEGGYTPISCCRLLYTFEVERRRGNEEPLLRQHPRRMNGCSIYYVGLGELAVEVSFPDALDSEVRQIVYTFTRHEPSKILIQQGRKLLNQA